MSRWIDGEWLLNFFEPYPDDYQTPLGALRACVDDAPSIDIVHCRECKHWRNKDKAYETWSECELWTDDPYETAETNADDFCSYGEREGE